MHNTAFQCQYAFPPMFWRLGGAMPSQASKYPFAKGGVPGPDAPKMQALPEWGGGSDPCLDFCEGFVHMH